MVAIIESTHYKRPAVKEAEHQFSKIESNLT